MQHKQHLINGKHVKSAKTFTSLNPATQDVLAEVAAGGETEVHAAVAAAKDAFPKWANTPATERARSTPGSSDPNHPRSHSSCPSGSRTLSINCR